MPLKKKTRGTATQDEPAEWISKFERPLQFSISIYAISKGPGRHNLETQRNSRAPYQSISILDSTSHSHHSKKRLSTPPHAPHTYTRTHFPWLKTIRPPYTRPPLWASYLSISIDAHSRHRFGTLDPWTHIRVPHVQSAFAYAHVHIPTFPPPLKNRGKYRQTLHLSSCGKWRPTPATSVRRCCEAPLTFQTILFDGAL